MTARIAAAFISAGVIVGLLIFGGGDVAMAHALRDVDPAAKRIAGWVTRAGDPTPYLVAAALAGAYLFLDRRGDAAWRAAGFCFAAIVASGIIVNVLKFFFGRTRPGVLFDRGVVEFMGPTLDSAIRSFPSGHAATVGAVATLAWIFLPRLRWAALAFALVVGASRLVVGYHFASDVIAGLLVGWGSVALPRLAFARRGWWPVAHAA